MSVNRLKIIAAEFDNSNVKQLKKFFFYFKRLYLNIK